jgi:hypothetical protein
MLIIRRLNFNDAAPGIVTLSQWQSGAHLCTGRPLTENDDTRCCINTIQPPDDEHIMLETCRGLRVTIPGAASIQFNLLMMNI